MVSWSPAVHDSKTWYLNLVALNREKLPEKSSNFCQQASEQEYFGMQ